MAYTTIDDPSQYFQTAIYNGSSSSVTVTNDGNSDLKPDWLWFKKRSASGDHNAFDTSRGLTERIFPNLDSKVDTGSNGITSLTDGFTSGTFYGDVNGAGQTFVTWQWKANGGTTSTNDASATGVGSIDSVIQANTTAGFSIVTHTGSGSSGTIAHGLGVKPDWVLTKNRTDNSEDWAIYHVGLSSAEYYIRLNTNAAQAAGSSVWGDTAPSSTVITLGGANGKNNASSKLYVSYCFAPIQGYSKFGSYTGNGNADGAFVYTGFRPAWIMGKRSSGAHGWFLFDDVRDTFNPTNQLLEPSNSNAETNDSFDIDILSNGFKLRGSENTINGDGESYIYMAFARHPFVSSEGVPVTAR
jgi:hypothetical protein